MALLMRLALAAFVGLVLIGLGGCSKTPTLAATPYVMIGEPGRAAYAEVMPHLRTADIPVMYFTDREPELDAEGHVVGYTHKRSATSAFGTVVVSPTREMGWAELVEASTTADRKRSIGLEVSSIVKSEEFGTLRERLRAVDGELVYPPESTAGFLQDVEEFNRCLEPWLEPGNDNGVLVYVHGVYSPFNDAAIRLADSWHASGRHGVPIVFSWPTGRHGFKAFNYAHDQESGDFAVADLKLLLNLLALNERVARVHLVAWSRGNEVVITALRELHEQVMASQGQTMAAQLARGKTGGQLRENPGRLRLTAEVMKLETVMLVAADLDLDVFEERVFSERVSNATGRLVIYTSRSDMALSIADLFFQSGARLGQADELHMDPVIRELIPQLPGLEMIECRVPSKDSHAYLFEHPGALSDMISVIRDDRPIGAEHGRPLKEKAPGFWLLDTEYLAPE